MLESTRTLKVKQLNSPELTMTVSPDITIGELKAQIQAQQRLVYQERPLKDGGKAL